MCHAIRGLDQRLLTCARLGRSVVTVSIDLGATLHGHPTSDVHRAYALLRGEGCASL